ncbi:CU044_2847 family protein [Streptomyces sp. TG1A-8]|uniref:CU044_2847 family protein n=1 Tax=Streptomyces sp. TG1A-8 TaxID=3051385 RepID=UPI00265B7921|nr:CU044_2847 family protein [Streptomyces sp. TG1A-8]MDO0927851.1 CU044_2847 family protein [Streptomyces sp. TG1A-8]
MGRLVEFRTEDGAVVVVETNDPGSGTRLVARGDGPAAQAAQAFEGALDGVRAAAQSALRVFRDGALRPDSVELEFGVRLTAEAGAVIAKGAAEGQLVVRLGWTSRTAAREEREGPAQPGTPAAAGPPPVPAAAPEPAPRS